MKKSVLSICLAALLLLSCVPQNAYAAQSDEAVIDALNAALIGVVYPQSGQIGDVSSWSDNGVSGAISRKLLWDYYWAGEASYLDVLGMDFWTDDEGYWRFDLELIDRITQDTLGRTYPRGGGDEVVRIQGDELLVIFAMGERTSMSVDSISRNGGQIIAKGSAAHLTMEGTQYLGAFTAVFDENPSSVYGYTLRSLSKSEAQNNSIQKQNAHQNTQNTYGNVKASASSELEEPWAFHCAGHVLDGDRATVWAEADSGYGINEWVKLESVDGSKLDIAAIEFAMGFQESEDLLRKNAWPYKLLIECEGGYSEVVELSDYNQTVVLKQLVETKWIKFTILEAHAGTKYEDTCISEIRLIDSIEADKTGLIDIRIHVDTDNNELTVEQNDIIALDAYYTINGLLMGNASDINITINDSSVLEFNSIDSTKNLVKRVELKAIAEGTTEVVFEDAIYGEQVVVPITVYTVADNDEGQSISVGRIISIAAYIAIGCILFLPRKKKKVEANEHTVRMDRKQEDLDD